ncbi:MAG: hypothetical protein AAGA56_22780, partial [Myxococcota bacterium]
VRRQPGTGSLRALLYIDEVFGFLPPVAEPPSKRVLLTLLKQARAQGLGVVLASQNPVDLDYKALSNAGTWWLGRMQTARDVDRVADGLATARVSRDLAGLRASLARLPSRCFLMNNVHETEPVTVHARWAMSYLRGPLTRPEVERLAAPTSLAATPRPSDPSDNRALSAISPAAGPVEGRSERPMLNLPLEEVFLAPAAGATGALEYVPSLLATVEIAYQRARPPVDHLVRERHLAPLVEGRVTSMWRGAERFDKARAVADAPLTGLNFRPPPPGWTEKKLRDAEKAFIKHIAKTERLRLWSCLGETSEPGESNAVFLARLRQTHREGRDRAVAEVKAKFEKRHTSLMNKIRRAQDKLAKEAGQAEQRQLDTALSVGTTVLGAIFGRRTTVSGHAGRAAAAVRKGAAARREKGDVARAERDLAALQGELQELDEELTWALTEVKADAAELPEVKETAVRPSRGGVEILEVVLAWTPVAVEGAAGPT